MYAWSAERRIKLCINQILAATQGLILSCRWIQLASAKFNNL